MDLVCGTGKNRRNTGSILRLFAEVRRKTGGSYGGHELISASLSRQPVFPPQDILVSNQ
jgi:hypothetical protein